MLTSEGGKGASQADIWEGALQTEGTAGAKAPRWVRCWARLKNDKMAMWLEGSGRGHQERGQMDADSTLL